MSDAISKPINRELEEILGAKGRVRLLMALVNMQEVNITRLIRLCGVQHASAKRNLDLLVKHGVVIEKRFGKLRIYSLNMNSSIARAIKNMITDIPEAHYKVFS